MKVKGNELDRQGSPVHCTIPTQEDLAEQMGASANTIRRMEAGHPCPHQRLVCSRRNFMTSSLRLKSDIQ